MVLTVEQPFEGQPATLLVRRWRGVWRWYAVLAGHTEVRTLAAYDSGVFWGSAQGWGYFSRATGICETTDALRGVHRIVAIDDGAVFLLGVEPGGAPAYQWLFP